MIQHRQVDILGLGHETLRRNVTDDDLGIALQDCLSSIDAQAHDLSRQGWRCGSRASLIGRGLLRLLELLLGFSCRYASLRVAWEGDLGGHRGFDVCDVCGGVMDDQRSGWIGEDVVSERC